MSQQVSDQGPVPEVGPVPSFNRRGMIGMMVGAVLGRLVPVEVKAKHTGVDYFFDIWEDRDIEQFYPPTAHPKWRVIFSAAHHPNGLEGPSSALSHPLLTEAQEGPPGFPTALHPSHSAAAKIDED
jgi:hypothetical protein